MNAITPVAGRTHADAASAALRQALAASHSPLRDAVASYRTAAAGLTPDADLVVMMKAANAVSLAAEALAAAATEMHKAVDAALVASMSETGGTQFRTDAHLVSLCNGAPSVEITGEVPETFLTTPSPRPDRNAIRAALKAGRECNWAHLLPGNPYIQRRANS